MDPSESPWKIHTILPGALLVLVACSQLYLTQFSELTPPKGGGFGMFAVVDSVPARGWSIDCLTQEGRPCRVYIARGETRLSRWMADELRPLPDARNRALAADRVFRSRFVPASYDAVAAALQPGEVRALKLAKLEGVPVYRLPAPRDDSVEPVRLKAIRLQVWRLRFDADANQVRSEPVGMPEIRGEW